VSVLLKRPCSDDSGTNGDELNATGNIKVLSIIGAHRSGSTVLDRVLGLLDGFLCTGELRFFFLRSAGAGYCGCGKLLRDCDFWSKIHDTVMVNGGSPLDPMQIRAWQEEELRSRSTWRILRQRPRSTADWPALAGYIDAFGRLYRAIAEVSGARVIIDSSKVPKHAAVLESIPEITPYYIHLVRDPRGVAHSWERQKRYPHSNALTKQYSTTYSVARWAGINILSEVVCRTRGRQRTLRVRYEDFVRHPARTLADIGRVVDERVDTSVVADDGTVEFQLDHTVEGNPDRVDTGRGRLREDAKWVRGLTPAQKLLATSVGLPLILRYGYPVIPRSLARRAASPADPPG
jgi:hypothetical protein